MKKVWSSFTIAIAMYSKIPMKTSKWEKDNMRYTMCFFPVVGIIVGIAMLLWAYIGGILSLGTTFRTAGCVLIPILITGGIHLDGLLDTSDALSSYQPMERKLEILKDSHAGAFAIIVLGCYLVGAFGIWSEVSFEMLKVIAVGYVLSRALSGYSIVTIQCAKNSGLVAMFSDAASKKVVQIILLMEIITASVTMLVINFKYGICGLLGALIVFIYYRRMSIKQFGGITGDLAGFFLQICELVMALFVVIGGMIWAHI